MKIILLFLSILALLLGIRYAIYFSSDHQIKPGDEFDREVTLLASPRVSFTSQTFRVDGVTIKTDKENYYSYGDRLHISGRVEEDSFDSNGKSVTVLEVNNPKIEILPQINPFVKSAAFIKARIEHAFNRYLPRNEAALLFGIVFGGSQGFSRQTQDEFRNAGVLHVVAASGMNVSMVAAFLLSMLSLFLRRQTALALAIAGVFYYALLSGLSPSIVRASIMASVAFSAAILGRQNYGIIALLVTAFIMLLIAPENLFDIGFLLSFTSTLGILLIKPIFDGLNLFKKTKVVSEDITTSVSAQLGSIPVMLMAFGSYSFISILVNALVLWTIAPLMILGGIAALCAIAVPFVSVIFLYLCYPLLLFFETVVSFFGKIQPVSVENVSWTLVAGYYLILFALILLVQRKRKDEI